MNCPRCGRSIDGDPSAQHQCAAPIGSGEHTVVYHVVPGDVLDEQWRVESRVGQGAMGSVYLGTDVKRNRPVAIKILSPEHCRKPKVLARFEREARLMLKLRHPNIVQLEGVGRRGALPYIVMQYLEGQTLADFLRQRGGKLPPNETLEVVRQLCAGLSFIHHHGLVHRDVKPQNIFISSRGHVTILDLGVARDKSTPGLTKVGAMVGTPYYMSPEQIQGTAQIDRRTDLYALGAVIFELLTGAPPFVAETNFEVLRAHREQPPPDASEQSGFVPRAVAQVIRRALAKSADDRQQNVHELLADLEAAYALDSERTNPNYAYDAEQTTSRGRTPSGGRPAASPPAPELKPVGRIETRSSPGTKAPELKPVGRIETRSNPGVKVGDSRSSPGVKKPPEPPPAPAQSDTDNTTTPVSSLGEAFPTARLPGAVAHAETVVAPLPQGRPAGAGAPDARRTQGDASFVDSGEVELLQSGESSAPADALRTSATQPVIDLRAYSPNVSGLETDLRERALNELEDERRDAARKPTDPNSTVVELGELRVVTTLKGLTSSASLFVDNLPRGATPSYLQLQVGVHRVRIERAGFAPVERDVIVAAGQVALLRVELERT